jgi:DNA modification methylase
MKTKIKKPIQVTQWTGCYDQGWHRMITPDSYSHPAKMARGLLEQIINHGFERGWWQKNSIIADPFGGVGNTGLIGAYHGLRVVSVELEPRFVTMAQANYQMHASKLARLGCPMPVILQGDSRDFDRIVGPVVGCVTSPPFATQQTGGGLAKADAKYAGDGRAFGKNHGYQNQADSPRNIAALPAGDVAGCLTSPPYISGGHHADQTGAWNTNGRGTTKGKGLGSKEGANYGATLGQIGKLKPGDVVAVVSPPPFQDCGINLGDTGDTPARRQEISKHSKCRNRAYGNKVGQIGNLKGGTIDGAISSPPYAQSIRNVEFCGTDPDASDRKCGPNSQQASRRGYGHATGQIGTCKGGFIDGAISSPPYGDIAAGQGGLNTKPAKKPGQQSGRTATLPSQNADQRYGQTKGQISRESPETYWEACRSVYAAVGRTLKPGGVMVLVTKDFVKAGKRVLLSDDTVTLCESLGFVLIERVQAMLVSETRHADLFTGEDVETKSRKSFFRRLHEKRPGAVKIDFEDVLIFSKP